MPVELMLNFFVLHHGDYNYVSHGMSKLYCYFPIIFFL